MQTVLMAIAVVQKEGHVLLRRMDPARNPYQQPWELFGAVVEGSGVLDCLNRDFKKRWGFEVSISEQLWWDSEIKTDHDGEKKLFVYLDVARRVVDGKPRPLANPNEELEWVDIEKLGTYELNPPSHTLLSKMKLL